MLKAAPTFYWINLDRSQDRRDRIAGEFKKHDVGNVRIPAVDGRALEFTRGPRGESVCELGTFTASSLVDVLQACTLSHLKAVKMFYESGDAVGVICEDDMTFEYLPKWKDSLADVIGEAPPDCDVLQLGVILDPAFHNESSSTAAQSNYRLLFATEKYIPRVFGGFSSCWSTIAYSITRAGAKKLLEAHNTDASGKHHITVEDYAADLEGVYHRDLNIYTFYRPLFTYPAENDSLLHSSHLTQHEVSKEHVTSLHEGVASPTLLTITQETAKRMAIEVVIPTVLALILRLLGEHHLGLQHDQITSWVVPDLENCNVATVIYAVLLVLTCIMMELAPCIHKLFELPLYWVMSTVGFTSFFTSKTWQVRYLVFTLATYGAVSSVWCIALSVVLDIALPLASYAKYGVAVGLIFTLCEPIPGHTPLTTTMLVYLQQTRLSFLLDEAYIFSILFSCYFMDVWVLATCLPLAIATKFAIDSFIDR